MNRTQRFGQQFRGTYKFSFFGRFPEPSQFRKIFVLSGEINGNLPFRKFFKF